MKPSKAESFYETVEIDEVYYTVSGYYDYTPEQLYLSNGEIGYPAESEITIQTVEIGDDEIPKEFWEGSLEYKLVEALSDKLNIGGM